MRLHKVTNLIEEVVPKISSAKDKSVVLTVGITGVGKSTSVNYLLGYSMKKGEDGHAMPVESSAPAPIGDGAESVTLYPTIYKGPDKLVYCDCPGFLDTRGSEVNVYNSIAMEMLVNTTKSIPAILVIVDYYSVVTQHGEGLRKLATILGRLLKNPNQAADSVLFLLTKFPSFFTKEIFGKKIDSLLEEEQKQARSFGHSLMSLEQSILRETLDRKSVDQAKEKLFSLQDKISILLLLKKGIKNGQVVMLDIFDKGKSRIEVVKKIDELTPISKEQFDFSCYEDGRMQFNQIVFNTMSRAISLANRLQILPSEFKKCKSEIQIHDEQITFYKKQVIEIYKKEAEKIQRPVIIGMQNEKITELLRSQKEHNIELKSINQEIKDIEFQLSLLDTTDPILYWELSLTEDNATLPAAAGFLLDLLPMGVGTIATSSISIFQSLYYAFDAGKVFCYQDLPFINVEKSVSDGQFYDEYSDSKSGKYSISYKGNQGAESTASVKIFVEKRLVPENKREIDYLKGQLDNLKKNYRDLSLMIKEESAQQNLLENLVIELKAMDSQPLKTSKKDIEEIIIRLEKSVKGNWNRLHEIEEEEITLREEVNKNKSLFLAIHETVHMLCSDITPLKEKFLTQLEILFPKSVEISSPIIKQSSISSLQVSSSSFTPAYFKHTSTAQKLYLDSSMKSSIKISDYRKLAEKASEEKVLDEKSSEGETALHIALRNRQFEKANILIEFGANARIKNKNGQDSNSIISSLLEESLAAVPLLQDMLKALTFNHSFSS